MEMIEFGGEKFPFAIINLPWGERKISTSKLNDSLMNIDGSYVSDEARLVDEEIFYFVEDEEIHFCQDKLIQIILSEI